MADNDDGCISPAAAAAEILCSLSKAKLSIWPPAPWLKADLPQSLLPTWPATARGKRSRRDAPATAAALKEKRMRASPTSALELSGGSATSTSGSSSPDDRRLPPTLWKYGGAVTGGKGRSAIAASKEPLILRALSQRSIRQRPRKKMRLPEMQEEVRSLLQENAMLKKVSEELRMACNTLSTENQKIELRLDQSEKITSQSDSITNHGQSSSVKKQGDGFHLPDLNLPPPVDF